MNLQGSGIRRYMIKHFLTILFFSLLWSYSAAQLDMDWFVKSNNGDLFTVSEMTTSKNGDHVYIVGQVKNVAGNIISSHSGSSVFVPVDTSTGTNPGNGNVDGFICSFDLDGNFEWVTYLGGAGDNDMIEAVDTDSAGNIFITGYFESTLTATGTGYASSLDLDSGDAQEDVFVAMLDEAAGTVTTTRLMTGSGKDFPSDITVTNDEIYVSFLSNSSDLSCQDVVLSGTGYYTGLAKYIFTSLADDWVITGDSAGDDIGAGFLSAKQRNNVVVYEDQVIWNGIFNAATFTFNWAELNGVLVTEYTPYGTSVTSPNPANSDVFVVSFDDNGNMLWAKSICSNVSQNLGTALSFDAGGVYLSGSVVTTNVDEIKLPSGTTHNSTTLPTIGTDSYVIRLDPTTGDELWIQVLEETSSSYVNSISVDRYQNVLLAGAFEGDLVFNGTAYSSVSGSDAFIAILNDAGDEELIWFGGGNSSDRGVSVSYNAVNDEFLFAGSNSGNFTWDAISYPGSVDQFFLMSFNPYLASIDEIDFLAACPIDVSVNNDAGACGAIFTYSQPIADEDLVAGYSITQTSGPVSGTEFPVGDTTIEYELTDGFTVWVCNYIVTVNDNEIPIVNCPSDITLFYDSDCKVRIGDYTGSASGSDNCTVSGSIVYTQSPVSSTIVSGTTVVTITGTDESGNTNTCTLTVFAVDNTPPVTPTLSDVTGQCTAMVTAPTTTDNCSGTITGTTSDALTYSAQGTYVITWTFSDGNGNSISVNQNVVINDTTDPVTPTLSDVTGQCTATATAPTTTDNCSGTITGTTSDALTYSAQGTYVITWTFADGNGNSISVNQNVVINDTTDPVTPTLSDVTGQCTATATAPTTTDNCSGTITGTTSDALTYSTQGTHTITWTFADGNGNSISVNQDVVIDDTTDPVTPTISDVTGQCTATAAATPTTTDNCSGTITGTTSDALTYSTQGTHTITWTFADGNGNSISVNQDVVIDDTTDPVTPTISDVTGQCTATAAATPTTDNCSGTITGTTSDALTYTTQGAHIIIWNFDDGNGNSINVNQNVVIDDTVDPVTPTLSDVTGQCTATATAPTTTDACSGTITGTTSDALTYSTQGTYVITWTFADGNGNSISVNQNVVINDTTDPVTPTLSDVIGQCTATATAPTTTDNCSGTITGTTSDALTYSTQGTHTITWTFADGNGNSISVNQDVVIDDTTDPVTLTLSDVTGQCTATATVPTTTDNCSGTITGTTSDALTYSTQGTHVITWTFDDGNGNSINVNQNVVIDDTTDPVTPTLVDVTGQCTATATVPTTTDACLGTITGTTSDALTYTTQGTHVITWTLDDGNGNSINVNQNVVINDTTDPVTPTLVDVTGQCTATATAPTTTDNCSGTITGTTGDALTYSTQGTHIITWTFDDGNGNSINVNQNVVIDDTVDPVTPTLSDVTGECTATVTIPTTTDACSGTITGTTSDALTYSTQGTHVITWTFDDGNGNSINVNQNVVIDDTADPVMPILSDVTGQCTATATAPTTTDACLGTITGTTTDPLTYTVQGTYTITWTFDDGNGNSIDVNQTVIVDDTIDPITPTLLDVIGQCSATVSIPTTTDACSGTITGTTSDPLAYIVQGTYTITWTFDDGNGNSIDVNQTVVVDDTTDPIAVCQDITLQLDVSGNGSLTVFDIDGGSSDNCNFTLGASNTTFDCSDLGINIVTLTITDDKGNTSSCDAQVNVVDSIDPTPLCQDLVLQLDASGSAILDPTQLDAGSSDNCTTIIFSASQTVFDCSHLGTNTITLTVTDDSGNTASCDAVVTIEDNIAPIVLCQNITIQLDASGNASIDPIDLDNGSSDNCGFLEYELLGSSTFNCSNIGTNPIVLIVKDASGNSDFCAAVVTIEDNTNPIAICRDLTLELDNTGSVSIMDSDLDNGSSDNCGTLSFSATQTLFDCSHLGTNTITLTVTDGTGNFTTCESTVTVEDNIDPVAVCRPLIAQLDASGTAIISAANIDNGSSDNCGSVSLMISQTTFDCSHIGMNTVQLTVTDGSGNTDVCDAQINVIDIRPPTAICQDIVISLNASGTATITAAQLDGGSYDNCSAVSLVASKTEFDCSDLGDNTVILTVRDALGNFSTCLATVTVEDNIEPTAICQNVTIELDATGNVSITADQVENGSTDNCTTFTYDLITQVDFDCSDIGVHPAILEVTDASGNSSQCVSLIEVVDVMAPIAICQNLTVQLDGFGDANIIASDLDGGSTDNCGTISFGASQTTFDCSNLGDNAVTLTVTDDSGNSSTCVAIVTVEDLVDPIAICQDVTIYLDAFGIATITANDIDGGSTDNCVNVTLSASQTAFNCGDLGLNTVTLSVEDGSGNIATCDAIVDVVDNIDPVAVCQNITVALDDSGNASIVALDVENGSTDNCSGLTSSLIGQTTYDCSDLGLNPVILQVTDTYGNTSICTAIVEVVDSTEPVAMCQDITIQLDAAGSASIIPSQIDGGSFDNCAAITFTASQTTFDCSNMGDNTVTLTVEDGSGNTSTCDAVVTVVDTEDPVAMCTNIVVQLDVFGNGSIVPAQLDNGSYDNCGEITLTASKTTFTCADLGPDLVTLTVTDDSGNSSTCDALVNVVDLVNPIAICQNITIELNSAGIANIVAADIDGGSTDNCGIQTLVASKTGFNCSDVGANDIDLTVIDASGNTNTCTAIVTVVDAIDPLIQNLPVSFTISTTAITCSATTNWVEPTASDICGVTMVSSIANGTELARGVHEVIYTATDTNGNVTQTSFFITIEDDVNPIIAVSDTIWAYSAPYLDFKCGIEYVDIQNDPNLVITDNCEVNFATVDIGGLYMPNEDGYPISISVDDTSGNTGNNAFVLMVRDTLPPIPEPGITPPTEATYTVAENCSIEGAPLQYVDNCTSVNYVPSIPLEDLPHNIPTNVTWTISDDNGNNIFFDQVITVDDPFGPDIDYYGPTEISADASTCLADITDMVNSVTFSDPCDDILTLTTSIEVLGPDNLPFTDFTNATIGIYTLIYDVSDPAMNAHEQVVQTIFVVDDTPPVISDCWNDTTIVLSDNCDYTLPDFVGVGSPDRLTFVDCSGVQEPYYNSDPFASDIQSFDDLYISNAAGDVVNVEILVRDLSLTHINIAVCQFSVTFVDETAPILDLSNLSDTIVLDKVEDCQVIIPDYSADLIITEHCGIDLIDQDPAPGTYDVIDYENFDQIIFEVYDESGNMATDSLPLRFEDNMIPYGEDIAIASIEVGQQLSNGQWICDYTIYENWITAPVTGIIAQEILGQGDNCTHIDALEITLPELDESPFGEIQVFGSDTLIFEIKDEMGNISEVPLVFDVTDSSVPYWSDDAVVDNLTVFTEEDGDGCGYEFIPDYPLALDQCNHDISYSYLSDPEVEHLNYFPAGEYTITYFAEDEYSDENHSNRIDTTFNLIVVDNTPPVIDQCPGGLQFCTPLLSMELIFGEEHPMADDCGNPLELVQDASDANQIVNGDLFPIGFSQINFLATDSNGNSSYCQVTVEITDLLIANLVLDDKDICVDESALLYNDIAGISSPGGDWWLFSEFNGVDYENSISVIDSIEFTPSHHGAGRYKIKYQDGSDVCHVSDSLEIVVHDLPEIILPELADACILEMELPIPTADGVEYEWSNQFGVLPINGDMAMLVAEETTQFSLYINAVMTDPLMGCQNVDSIDVTLYEVPEIDAGEDQQLDFTTTVLLTGTIDGEGEIVWESTNSGISFDSEDDLETDAYDLALGENHFTFTVTNGVCETVTDEVIISVQGFVIPSAFTPNGDGINDLFEIEGLNSFANRSLSVFNRWGKPIYENNNYTNDWDARTSSGNELPEDTYFYILKLDTETHSGYIIVKR